MAKVLITISRDEWWPVYQIDERYEYGTPVEVDSRFLAKYIHASKLFDEVQDELERLYRGGESE